MSMDWHHERGYGIGSRPETFRRTVNQGPPKNEHPRPLHATGLHQGEAQSREDVLKIRGELSSAWKTIRQQNADLERLKRAEGLQPPTPCVALLDKKDSRPLTFEPGII